MNLDGHQKSALLPECVVVTDIRPTHAWGYAVRVEIRAQVVRVGDTTVSGLSVLALTP